MQFIFRFLRPFFAQLNLFRAIISGAEIVQF